MTSGETLCHTSENSLVFFFFLIKKIEPNSSMSLFLLKEDKVNDWSDSNSQCFLSSMPPHGHISEMLLGSSPPVFVIGVLICPYLYVVIPMFLFEDSVCVDKIFKPVERWLCESQCSYMQIQVTSIIVCYVQCLCQSWIPKRNWSFQAFSSVGIWKRGFLFF